MPRQLAAETILTPLHFSLHFSIYPPQQIPRRPLHRPPRGPFPRAPRGARWRVLHPGHVERRSPALLIVAGELQVVALADHAHGDVADAAPRVQPAVEGVKDWR